MKTKWKVILHSGTHIPSAFLAPPPPRASSALDNFGDTSSELQLYCPRQLWSQQMAVPARHVLISFTSFFMWTDALTSTVPTTTTLLEPQSVGCGPPQIRLDGTVEPYVSSHLIVPDSGEDQERILNRRLEEMARSTALHNYFVVHSAAASTIAALLDAHDNDSVKRVESNFKLP